MVDYNNDKLNEIYRDTWPNLGWAQKDMKNKFQGNYQGPLYARHPDLVMTHEEMLEEAARREAVNKQVYPDGDSIESFPNVTRVEVIGKKGREYTEYGCSNVQVSIQDGGLTLKVFLS